MDKSNTSGSAEDVIETRNYANSSLNPETLKHQSFPIPYTSPTGERKNFKRAANRGRKGSRVLSSRTYPLRSSESTVRFLRSRSVADRSPSDAVQITERAAEKPPSDSVDAVVKPPAKRIKRDRPTKDGPDDELLKIRKRIRYVLNRMNYQQSFLEAYANEGWKNQSLEKIRPEKELERAKEEIVRCKLRIREAFQNLDHLLTLGKLEESLFDSEGEISSDDIVCATCSLQDVTLNNDIILCDGACDRGFHQNCLNPPLLTKDIPEGEEGWLCPACDCKIDCIELINELQGTDLDINDSWEKVFPEAAAVAHGSMQNDIPDLPSDDSEDDDFDPNISEEHVSGHVEGSSEEGDEGLDSDDSNFITSSENSEHVKEKEKVDDLGLPSEDSEDDDYDPAGPDSDKDIEEKQDESDFTSDSDDFCAEITKSCGKDEVSSGPKVGDRTNDLEGAPVRPNTSMSHLTTKDLEIDQDVILSSRRRQVQRLDYKKLYDDTYGEAPSDSSGAEEWSGKSTLKVDNEERNEVDSFACKSSRGTRAVHPDSFHGLVNDQHAGGLTSDGSNSKANRRQFGPVINERLNQHFTTEQYPSRAVKESLAQELGLTFRQVNKWFESTRHARAAAMKNGTQLEKHSNSRKKKSSEVTHMEVSDQPNACKEEGIRQDSPVKQDTDGGQRTHVPPESSQCTKTSGLVGCPKSESRKNHEKNTSSKYVGIPTDGSAEDQILGLEPEDEGSDSDDLNFVFHSGNSEPLKNRGKVDDLELPSAYSEDDDYDSDEDTENMQPCSDESDSDESNFITSSDNPEDVKEKVDDLGLPSEDSEDDDYDPAGPDSDEGIGKKQSSSDKSLSSDKSENTKMKKKVDDLGLPSEDSEDDDYDPASPDSDKDIEEKQEDSEDDDFSSDSDDFCDKIAKSCCGQEGVPSGAKVDGDRTNDLEGTTICANAAISNLPSKDAEMGQYVVLPVSARQQVQSPDSKKLYAAYGKAPSDSSYGEDLSKKGTPEKDNAKESEAGSFGNEFTPQRSQQSLHGPVNGQHAEELLTPNGSSTTGQKRQYGPIINQRLHEQFETDPYPSRAVKESLARELGLTLRQVERWFESKRRRLRVASSKNSTHVENHSTKETMVENPNICKSEAVNEDTPSGILNEGITQDGPLKQDIGDGLRTNVSPQNNSQRYTTPLVKRPKGESRENHMKNTSSSGAGRPEGSDAGCVVLALEAVDEKTRDKMLRELKKRKIG